MIFTVTLGLIAAVEAGIILYLLEIIRVEGIEREEKEIVLTPPEVSQYTRNKMFGYHIERFGKEAYQDGKVHNDKGSDV